MYEKAEKDGNKTWVKSGRNYISTWYLHVIVAHSKTCYLPCPAPRPKINAPPILYGLCTFFFPSFLTSTCMSPTAKAKTS